MNVGTGLGGEEESTYTCKGGEEPGSRKGPFSSWTVGEEGESSCCKKQPCSQKFLKFPMKMNHLNQFKC